MADRNYESEMRTADAKCADCGTVRQFGEFLKFHVRLGSFVSDQFDLVCGPCLVKRCETRVEENA